MPSNEEFQTAINIAGLQKDVIILSKVVDKLDQTLEKLEGVSQSLTRLIELHEQKFKYLEEDITELKIAKKKNGNGNYDGITLKQKKSIGNFIDELKTWHWMIIGGAYVFSWFVGHIDLVKFFEFFQNQTPASLGLPPLPKR